MCNKHFELIIGHEYELIINGTCINCGSRNDTIKDGIYRGEGKYNGLIQAIWVFTEIYNCPGCGKPRLCVIEPCDGEGFYFVLKLEEENVTDR